MTENNTTALEALAWASMNESTIVAKLATKYQAEGRRRRRRGRTGENGFNMVVIKELVASTVPPRGKAKARCAALVIALTEQKEKIGKRRDNGPIKWSEWKQPARNTRVSNLFKSKMAGFSFSEFSGSTPDPTAYMRRTEPEGPMHMFVTHESWHRASMIILAGQAIITWTISTTNRSSEMFDFVQQAARINLKRIVVRGGAVQFDPMKGTTIIKYPDGKTDEHLWTGERRTWAPTGKLISEHKQVGPEAKDTDD